MSLSPNPQTKRPIHDNNIKWFGPTNQTADILVEEQLQPPLDLVKVTQEQGLHKPNTEGAI